MSWLDSLKSWVGMKRDKAAQSLTADPASAYRELTYNRQSLANLIVHDLPPFTLATARIMLESDPLVRFALNVRNAAMSAADIEVKAANPRVKKWVEDQWKTLWNKHRGALTAVHRWGFAAIQPLWKECKDGTYDIADVKEFAPEDVRPLAHKGRPVGVRVRRPDVRLLSPRSCWITFDAEAGSFYGNGCLRRMYQPWYYKWMQGGQQKLLQQRMLKDAYIGDIFWYPADLMVKLPDGTQIPWKDITREIAECRVSGSALNLPMLKDRDGNKLVEYTPPQDIGGSSQIFDWGDKLNEDILLGADVAIEVVKASDTGSGFSGRSIPLMVTISACDQELVDIVKAIEIQILRPAAWLIFGGDPEFEITPKPLMESFAKDAGGSPMGGSAIGGQPGQVGQAGQAGQGGEGKQALRMGWVDDDGNVTQFSEDDDNKWITIGGRPEGEKKHKGGFPVQIDGEGRIVKSGGPSALVGKKVGEVKQHFDDSRAKSKQPQESPPAAPQEQKPPEQAEPVKEPVATPEPEKPPESPQEPKRQAYGRNVIGKDQNFDRALTGKRKELAMMGMPKPGETFERNGKLFMVLKTARAPYWVNSEDAEDQGNYGMRSGWYTTYTAAEIERTGDESAAKQKKDERQSLAKSVEDQLRANVFGKSHSYDRPEGNWAPVEHIGDVTRLLGDVAIDGDRIRISRTPPDDATSYWTATNKELADSLRKLSELSSPPPKPEAKTLPPAAPPQPKPAQEPTKTVSAPPSAPPKQGRIDLRVPYANKDRAKELGARWDPAKKVWYAPTPEVAERIRRARLER